MLKPVVPFESFTQGICIDKSKYIYQQLNR